MHFRTKFLAIVLILGGSAVHAYQPTATTLETTDTQSDETYQHAYRLAQTLRPSEYVRNYMDSPEYASALARGILNNPENAQLEQEYPGVTSHMVSAMTPNLIEATITDIPNLWTPLARLFNEQLSADEISAALDFYSSPEVIRFQQAATENIEAERLVDAVIDDEQISADELQGIGRDAARRTLEDSDQVTMRRFETFGRSPVGAKMLALMPRVFELEAAWTDDPFADASVESEIERVIENAVSEFIREAGQ